MGGFLFNEVGYFEQVLYLQLFAAIWLVNRDRVIAATCVMAVAPVVHEIAILTVIPVFGLVLLRNTYVAARPCSRPRSAALNLLVLALPASSNDGAVQALGATLRMNCDFGYRADALMIFARTHSDSIGLYRVHDILLKLQWPTIAAVGAFAAMWLSDRAGWLRDRDRLRAWLVLLVSKVRGDPLMPLWLVFAGWDSNRWMFVMIANLFVVTWLSIGYRTAPLAAPAIAPCSSRPRCS